MKTYLDVISRAHQLAADILPNPEALAPETPADYVAFVELETAKVGETLGNLSPDDLETAGGIDAWRALVVRAVTERAELAK